MIPSQLDYALPPLIVVMVGIALIVVVFSWAPATKSRSLFVGVLAGLIIWGLAVLGMRLSRDPDNALAWNQWTPVAIYVMFLFFYLFSREYTRVRGLRGFLVACWAILLFAIIGAPLGLFVESLRVESYGYAPVPGALAMPLGVAGLTVFLAAVVTLIRRYRISRSDDERSRLLYLVLGASFSLVGALLDIASNLPPVGIWANLVFCVVCSVALLEYQLLDIPQVARRVLTYLLVGITVAVPYVLSLLLLQRVFNTRLEGPSGYLVIVLLLAILLRPLYIAAQEMVDRLFYRNRYDALRALEQFGRDAQHAVDLDALACRVTSLVTEALHASRTCLFLPAENTDSLVLISCDGLAPLPQGGSFSQRSALVCWMAEHPEILAHRMLDVEPQLQSLSKRDRSLLDSLEADMLVPVTSPSGQLSGLLILGRKRSRAHYSQEDRRLLEALGRQMAVSLDNARLYRDAVRARHDLERWLDGMDDGVIIVGHDHTIHFLNRAARVNLRVSAGDPCWAVLGTGQACTRCLLAAAWTGAERNVRLSRRMRGRDYEIVAAQLTDQDGETSLISVLRDVTERNRFEDELRQSREQLRELALHQESVREDERAGIARELHDELGQLLTAIKMDLSWLSQHIGALPPEEAARRISNVITLTDTSVKTVQSVSSRLRPGILDDLGLVAALEWLARDFQQRSGIHCSTEVDSSIDIVGHKATVLFRICQESLTNVARHSGASEATVKLSRRNAEVVLAVQDNGRGITAEEMESPRSYGVMGMRERAMALGGAVSINGAPDRGTVVEATLPDA